MINAKWLVGAFLAVGSGPVLSYTLTQYWLTAADQQKIFIVQGGAVIQTITTGFQPDFEYTIAVGNTARTFGAGYPNYYGKEYDLTGTPTGNVYTAPANSVYFSMWDGTTDGYGFNYSLRQCDNTIVRYSSDWSNPVAQFTGAGMTGCNWGGITYDSLSDTLWVNERGVQGVFNNYALDGTLLTSFSLPHSTNWGLAYEESSDSLWVLSGTNSLLNVSKTGQLISETVIAGLQGNNILGGEMRIVNANQVPEPASLALVGAAMLAALSIRKRDKTSVQKS